MSDYYLGEIRMFVGDFAPQDWHLCDGTLLSVQDNQVLFSLIGTTYGGNGSTNFALPDLRGRIPVGQGQGASLTNRVLGQTGGSETVTLTEGNLPAHSHTFNTLKADAMTGTLIKDGQPNAGTLTYAQGENGARTYLNNNAPSPTPVTLEQGSISPAPGGNMPHGNMMPSFVVNYIIAINGLYPQRPN